MTLDETIKHFESLAESYESYVESINPKELAEWLAELKEAKRLLKRAVEDFSGMYDHIFDCDGMCETCPIHGERDNCYEWRYADEAKKLFREGNYD